MKKVVMALSGGMDSATLLGLLLEQGFTVHTCFFWYGSKHNKWERIAAQQIFSFYKTHTCLVSAQQYDLSGIFSHSRSNLLQTGGEIPEGHYESATMSKTIVPGRNMVFASIMAGVAESLGAEAIALGVHSGDHHIYPDCREEFIKALNTTISLSSDQKVRVLAPLIHDDKESILRRGYTMHIPVPYHLTRTCYKEQPISCGKCGSCWERLEAFDKIREIDPIKYEE